ncbi:MAG: cytochrome c oxidase assembly protein [Acidimicrobiia bacterium]
MTARRASRWSRAGRSQPSWPRWHRFGWSDWPLHDIAGEALVSVHMIEHLTLALVFPPLILLGVPSWLWQALLEPVTPVLRRITHPMVGLFAFNTVFAATHWPPILAIQNQSEWWHATGHVILVASGLLMKLAGRLILWTMITVIFFRWASAERRDDKSNAFSSTGQW